MLAARLEELIEVANLPGLNLTDLIQYSNRLRTLGLTAAETDTLLISTGQAITAFGGTAHTAAEATEQIIQAISSGTGLTARLSQYRATRAGVLPTPSPMCMGSFR